MAAGTATGNDNLHAKIPLLQFINHLLKVPAALCHVMIHIKAGTGRREQYHLRCLG